MAIVNVGGVEVAAFDRVVDHIRKHLETEPEVLPARAASEADSLAAEAEFLASIRPPHSLLLIGLVRPDREVAEASHLDADGQVAVLNADALRPSEEDPERYARRLEKETIRAIGLLLGLPPVPIPFSALYPHPNEQLLDAKGRTFDPPSHSRFMKIAEERRLRGHTD